MESYPGRGKLAQDIGVDSEASTTTPLLASILHKSRHSPPPPSVAVKQLTFPEQATDSQIVNRTANSIHRRPLDDSQLPPLSQEKLGQLRENDSSHNNSTFTPSLQPFLTNSLNTNENSNLRPKEVPKDVHPHTVTQNGLDEPRNLVDISMDSLNNRGIHAELGETFTGDNSLGVYKLLNSSEDLDKVAQLAGVKTEESGRDELDDFFDNALPSKSNPRWVVFIIVNVLLVIVYFESMVRFIVSSDPNSYMSEDLSAPLSSITGKVSFIVI